VLHHVGLIAGAAFITGAAGNALFFGIGFPMLSGDTIRLDGAVRMPPRLPTG
jgi:hypothetical protein